MGVARLLLHLDAPQGLGIAKAQGKRSSHQPAIGITTSDASLSPETKKQSIQCFAMFLA